MNTKQLQLCALLITGFSLGCASGDDDATTVTAGSSPATGNAGSTGLPPSTTPSTTTPPTGPGMTGTAGNPGGMAGNPGGMAGNPGGMAGNTTTAGGGGNPGTAGGNTMTAGMSGGGMGGGTAGMAGGMGGMSGGMGGMPGTTPPPPAGDCLKDTGNLGMNGKFMVMQKTAGAIKMWVPQGIPAGCKVPIIHLANGTGGTCGTYASVHQRLASHGFLATCYESTQTGAGTQGIMAFEKALADYPDMADKRFGSTGHSQGGQSSFLVLRFSEDKWPDGIHTGLAIEPASGFGSQPAGGTWQSHYGKIKSPMFMFSGTADILVSQGWVTSAFRALPDSIEAYHWSAVGATHVPTPNAETAQIAVPWFKWKLLGDNEACKAFFALEAGSQWNKVESQNEKKCM